MSGLEPNSSSELWVRVLVQRRAACLQHIRLHGRIHLSFLGGHRRQRRCGVLAWACWGVEHERRQIACTLGGSAAVVNLPTPSVDRKAGAGATEYQTESDRSTSIGHCWRGQCSVLIGTHRRQPHATQSRHRHSGFPYNWKAPACCSLSASDVEVTQSAFPPSLL